jgi:hypothetical protein
MTNTELLLAIILAVLFPPIIFAYVVIAVISFFAWIKG